MKTLPYLLFVATLVLVAPVSAQEPVAVPARPAGAETRQPDWQAHSRDITAHEYIQRRAQEKTAARQARIEGMKWIGYSPSRPVVSGTPFMSTAPRWVAVSPRAYWSPAFWSVRPYVGPSAW